MTLNYHVIVLIEVFRDCLSIQKVLRTKPLRIVPMMPIADSQSQRYLNGCLLPSLVLRFLLGLKEQTVNDLKLYFTEICYCQARPLTP